MLYFNAKKLKFTLIILLIFLSKIINAQIEKTTIPLNFDCTPKVDLRIYNPNTASPVPDDDEFTAGATGVANEEDFIVVEFLEILNVPSGEVTLKFEVKGENTSTYYIWNEDLSNSFGTFTSGSILTITKDASELPFKVLLQTAGVSHTYRDIAIEMNYEEIIDEARATIYIENNNPSIRIEDINEVSHLWRPDNPYLGNNVFITNISDALDYIHINNLGNYQVKPSLGGHVVNDFLTGGILSFSQILISEIPWGATIQTYEGSSQILIGNGKAALKIFEKTNGEIQQDEGYIAPFVFILHELAHIWLRKRDPMLKNFLSTITSPQQKANLFDSFELSGHDYTSTLEHDIVLEKLENIVCEQSMLAVRKYYRTATFAGPTEQMQILTLSQSQVPCDDGNGFCIENDIFYKSTNSTSITPE